jgi:hypothetical protein
VIANGLMNGPAVDSMHAACIEMSNTIDLDAPPTRSVWLPPANEADYPRLFIGEFFSDYF